MKAIEQYQTRDGQLHKTKERAECHSMEKARALFCELWNSKAGSSFQVITNIITDDAEKLREILNWIDDSKMEIEENYFD